MKKLSSLLRPDKSICYLDPLTTGPGLAAPHGNFATIADITDSSTTPDGWYTCDETPTLVYYVFENGTRADITMPLSRLSLPYYDAGTNGESRIICLGQTTNVPTFIMLPVDVALPLVQNFAEDFRMEIDSGQAGTAFIACSDTSSTARRTLWADPDPQFSNFGNAQGWKMNRNRHAQFEFYTDVRETGPARTTAFWTAVGFLAAIFQYGTSGDGWGNDPSIGVNGNIERWTLSDVQYHNLNSQIGRVLNPQTSSAMQVDGTALDPSTNNYHPVYNTTVIVGCDMLTAGYFQLATDFSIGSRVRFIATGGGNQALIYLPPDGSTFANPSGPWGNPVTEGPFNTPCISSGGSYYIKLGGQSIQDTLELQKNGTSTWTWQLFDFASYAAGLIPWSAISTVGMPNSSSVYLLDDFAGATDQAKFIAALATLPKGSTIQLGNRIYNINLTSALYPVLDGISINGMGMPEFNAGGTALVLGQGSIITGQLIMSSAMNSKFSNFGIDSGSAVVATYYGGVGCEGFGIANIPQTPSAVNLFRNVHCENISVLLTTGAVAHSFLFECVDQGSAKNIKIKKGYHGFVVKATNSVFDNIEIDDMAFSGVYILNNNYAQCGNIGLSNIRVNSGAGVKINGTVASIDNVNIDNVKVTNAIERGIMSEGSVSNIRVSGAVVSGAVYDGILAMTAGLTVKDSKVINSGSYGIDGVGLIKVSGIEYSGNLHGDTGGTVVDTGSLQIRGARAPMFVENDFLSGSSVAGCLPWNSATVGVTGTIANINTSDSEMIGAVRLASIATANTGWYMLTSITGHMLDGDEKTEIVFRVPAASATTVVRAGFGNSLTVTAPTNGVYMEIANLTATFRVRTNSVNTDAASTFTLTANTWYRLVIETNGTGSTTFYLFDRSGVPVTNSPRVVTAAIPSIAGREVGHGVLAYNTAATAVNLLDVCYMNLLNGKTSGMNR